MHPTNGIVVLTMGLYPVGASDPSVEFAEGAKRPKISMVERTSLGMYVYRTARISSKIISIIFVRESLGVS